MGDARHFTRPTSAAYSETPLMKEVVMLERIPEPRANISKGALTLRWFTSESIF
jgi:hypothetical protein